MKYLPTIKFYNFSRSTEFYFDCLVICSSDGGSSIYMLFRKGMLQQLKKILMLPFYLPWHKGPIYMVFRSFFSSSFFSSPLPPPSLSLSLSLSYSLPFHLSVSIYISWGMQGRALAWWHATGPGQRCSPSLTLYFTVPQPCQSCFL